MTIRGFHRGFELLTGWSRCYVLCIQHFPKWTNVPSYSQYSISIALDYLIKTVGKENNDHMMVQVNYLPLQKKSSPKNYSLNIFEAIHIEAICVPCMTEYHYLITVTNNFYKIIIIIYWELIHTQKIQNKIKKYLYNSALCLCKYTRTLIATWTTVMHFSLITALMVKYLLLVLSPLTWP